MTPTSPKTASHIGARPTPARSRTATFTAIANAMFCLAIPQGAAGDADGRGDPRGHVVHEGHVRRLDGRVRAHGAHGDPHVRSRQHGGVVDAVALAAVPGGAQLIHERGVAHGDPPAVDGRDDALAGDLGRLQDGAVVALAGEGVSQRLRDGVRGVALDVRGKVQEPVFVLHAGVHRHHLEDALGIASSNQPALPASSGRRVSTTSSPVVGLVRQAPSRPQATGSASVSPRWRRILSSGSACSIELRYFVTFDIQDKR